VDAAGDVREYCIDIVLTSFYSYDMKFVWDPEKDLINRKKHGIAFNEAIEVFNDPLHLSSIDHRFGYFEERWATVGKVSGVGIIVVVNLFFNEEGEEVIRVISAREATPNERRQYEDVRG